MITKFGKRFLTNYLAGNIDFSQREIAFGIGSTAADANGNDTKLNFEFYRAVVRIGSIDIVNTGSEQSPVYTYKVVYQATIPQDVAGVISEIALYPSSRRSTNNFDSNMITTFENNLSWTDSNNDNPQLQLNTTQLVSKIGENMVYFQVPASTVKEYGTPLGNLDLSGYSVNDSIAIAYKKADNNVSKIRLKFYSSTTQYCFVDFTPEAMGGTPDKIQTCLSFRSWHQMYLHH